MRRTPLTAMLTILAALATTLVVAGCGSKAQSSSKPSTSSSPASSTPSTTTHKHSTKPAY
jgi:hypothetical protein